MAPSRLAASLVMVVAALLCLACTGRAPPKSEPKPEPPSSPMPVTPLNLSIQPLDDAISVFDGDRDPSISQVRFRIADTAGRARRIAIQDAKLMVQVAGPRGPFVLDASLVLQSLLVDATALAKLGTPFELPASGSAALTLRFDRVRLVPGGGAQAIWVHALVDERAADLVVPVDVTLWHGP